MNQQEEQQPYKPKGVLPIRAEWRYRPDGSYFKGTKILRILRIIIIAISRVSGWSARFVKPIFLRATATDIKKNKVCLIARQRRDQELEQERKEREQVYSEFD